MPITLRSSLQNAGDVAQRSVGIIQVAQHHAILGFELVERALVGEVAAFAVRDGHAQNLALRGRRR